MKRLNILGAAALVAVSLTASPAVNAQENGNRDENGKIVRGPYETNRFGDNWFIGAGGGINIFMNENDVAENIRISPSIDANLGKWFTPCVGARLGYSGLTGSIWSPEATSIGNELNPENNLYKTNYNFTYVHADVLWNLSHVIGGYKETRLWNFIPYFHSGWLHTDSNTVKNFTDSEFGLGFGLLNNIRVHERINITLDVRSLFARGSFHAARIGATTNLSASLGLSVNLFKTNWTRAANWHNPKDTEKIAAVEATAAALTAANAALEADKAKLTKENEDLTAEVVELRKRPAKAALEDVGPASVYFEIGQTTLSQKELQHLDFYLKNILPNVGDKKVAVLTGSADSATGTARRNQYLSQKRVDYVLNLLSQKYGIEADRFEVRTQVAKEGTAALNRAVIISFE